MGNEEMRQGATAPAFAGTHEPRPLPFDPEKLSGLSERLIRSHWENNYCGAVKAYHLDYGAAAARYVDAFMQNVDWEIVSRRLVTAVGALDARARRRSSRPRRGEETR